MTVYVEQFSAHPLEMEAQDLYAPPDVWITEDGQILGEPSAPGDRPAYRVELLPEDGLYLLPFMGRRADGGPWETDVYEPDDPLSPWRQTFYPDATRVFEEIDRFLLDETGHVGQLSRRATFDHVRAAPSGGYRTGDTAGRSGAVREEELGRDFFPYRPPSRRREPPREVLARITNVVQRTLDSGQYDGAIWLEGSPYLEETAYWLNLLVDSEVPICCVGGSLGEGGRTNIVDAVEYVRSGIWRGPDGRDRIGAVCVLDERVFTAREVQKQDDRPGGFTATGGHGGVVASMGRPGPPVLTFLPVRRHTWTSTVRFTELPAHVRGLTHTDDRQLVERSTRVRDSSGELCEDAVPAVRIVKHARYQQTTFQQDDAVDVELLTRLSASLIVTSLVGFVLEGGTPYGDVTFPLEGAVAQLTYSGVPIVKVGRGDVGGFVPHERVPVGIAGGNLSATKARMLLMACLLRFGMLPPATDPANPSQEEIAAVKAALAEYQKVFDSH